MAHDIKLRYREGATPCVEVSHEIQTLPNTRICKGHGHSRKVRFTNLSANRDLAVVFPRIQDRGAFRRPPTNGIPLPANGGEKELTVREGLGILKDRDTPCSFEDTDSDGPRNEKYRYDINFVVYHAGNPVEKCGGGPNDPDIMVEC